ncbi:MAG: TVP38/TMEM64 family protein [Bacilli bacterium]|nr:TVP38/TMEM64 family protein [Bacilli bacterium]MBN2696072.1 TVP38/TMEM64 family protein [Bacilli bacterium]
MLKYFFQLLDQFEVYVNTHLWFAPLMAMLLPFIEAIIPSLPLTILIGFSLNIMAQVYGMVEGTVLTIVLSTLGSAMGMIMIFGIIRLTLAPFFARKVQDNKYGRMFLNIVEGPNVIPVLLVMSNPFFPSSILNYALSLTKTKFWRYFFLTITSRLIIVLFLVFLGSLFDIQNHPMNLLWVMLVYLLIFVIWYVIFHHRRKDKPNGDNIEIEKEEKH